MIERGRERSAIEKEERDTGGARRSKREVVGAKREREVREAQWFCYREAECYAMKRFKINLGLI